MPYLTVAGFATQHTTTMNSNLNNKPIQYMIQHLYVWLRLRTLLSLQGSYSSTSWRECTVILSSCVNQVLVLSDTFLCKPHQLEECWPAGTYCISHIEREGTWTETEYQAVWVRLAGRDVLVFIIILDASETLNHVACVGKTTTIKKALPHLSGLPTVYSHGGKFPLMPHSECGDTSRGAEEVYL